MIYLLIFLVIIMIVATILYSLSLINNIIYKVPQVSTFNSDLKLLKSVFDSYNLEWKKIVDLWSGTWKMLRLFEKEYNMKSTWFEIDFSNVVIAKTLNKLFWYSTKSFRRNYFKADLKEFNFVYVYLFPVLMEKVEEKIWNSCSKWTIIFVNAFKFEKHKPIKIYKKNWKDKIFVYEI